MIDKALFYLRPGAEWFLDGESYEGINWLDSNQSKPTEQEVQNAITILTLQKPFDECKEKAKQKIATTDWAVLPDVGLQNKSAFEAYRAELRALIIIPVADPQWPTEPTPEWS